MFLKKSQSPEIRSFSCFMLILRAIFTCATQHTVHSTQYTGHRTQDTVHSTQYTVHSTQYTVHSIQYTPHGTQYTVHRHCTLYTLNVCVLCVCVCVCVRACVRTSVFICARVLVCVAQVMMLIKHPRHFSQCLVSEYPSQHDCTQQLGQ